VIAGVALLVVLAVALFAVDRVLFGGPSGPPGAAVSVKIPEGASVEHIGDILDTAGVVSNGRVWALNVRLHGDGGGLRAGTYTLHENEHYGVILSTLKAGPAAVPTVRLTIPEGHALRDIATEDAPRAGISPAAYRRAARSARPPAGYRATGKEKLTIEGFLFPATYTLVDGAPARNLVDRQLAAFEDNFSKVDLSYAKSKNLSRYDVLVIASMIEREAQLDRERPLVAAVIYNRLKDGMTLGIDATIRYYENNWSRPLRVSELERPSAYNTRLNRGLPPTPIGNPGLASFKAAANPARKDYLFYVRKPGQSGEHAFSSTDAQFQRDVAKYQASREP
jgi:uncharacterized YceG family protein